MKYPTCPVCDKPWARIKNKVFEYIDGLYICDACGMMSDDNFGSEILSQMFGEYLIEWHLAEQESIIIIESATKDKEYKFSTLLPFDISIEKLKTLLVFS